MSINAGKVTVGFADKNGELVLVLLRDDSNQLNFAQWPMRRLEPEGHHALCQRIGNAALTMLIAAHPDEFAKFPLLVPPRLSTLDELRDLVLDLIRRSVSEKTTVYVAAIDNLFAQHAAELGQTDLPETWQSIRIRVMSRPAPS